MITGEQVERFLQSLRDHGLDIGIGEFARAQALLLRLRDSGEVADWASAGRWLAPVVCKNASEQAFVHRHAASWAAAAAERQGASASAEAPPARAEQHEAQARRISGLRRLPTAVAGVAVLALFLGAGLLYSRTASVRLPPQATAQDPAEVKPDLRAGGVLARLAAEIGEPPDRLAMLVTLWTITVLTVLTLSGRRRVLARRFSARRPETDLVRLVGAAQAFAEQQIRKSIQALRLRQTSPSRKLNVRKSIDATLDAMGLPTIVLDTRSITPEYLVLTPHLGSSDQHEDLASQLTARLREEQIHFKQFSYIGDPRRLMPYRVAGGKTIGLEELVAQHPHHRVIMVDTGRCLLDPATGRPVPWLRDLEPFDMRILFTPLPPREWGIRERLLRAAGFVVQPLAPEGLHVLADYLRVGAPRDAADGVLDPDVRRGLLRPFPRSLRLDPGKWLGLRPASPAELHELMTELEAFLDPPAFEWLCSLAVFPQIHPQLTRHLGALLTDAQGKPVLTNERLLDLSRLPWLRRAYMPDWLRVALIAELPAHVEEKVRDALQTVLLSATPDRLGFDLEIVPHGGRSFRTVLLDVVRREPPTSPLREYIFLGFMKGERVLALDAPRALWKRLNRARSAVLAVWAAAIAATAALWYVWPSGGVNLPVPFDPRALLGVLTVPGSVIAVVGLAHWALGARRNTELRGGLLLDTSLAVLLGLGIFASGVAAMSRSDVLAPETAHGAYSVVALLFLTLFVRLFVALPVERTVRSVRWPTSMGAWWRLAGAVALCAGALDFVHATIAANLALGLPNPAFAALGAGGYDDVVPADGMFPVTAWIVADGVAALRTYLLVSCSVALITSFAGVGLTIVQASAIGAGAAIARVVASSLAGTVVASWAHFIGDLDPQLFTATRAGLSYALSGFTAIVAVTVGLTRARLLHFSVGLGLAVRYLGVLAALLVLAVTALPGLWAENLDGVTAAYWWWQALGALVMAPLAVRLLRPDRPVGMVVLAASVVVGATVAGTASMIMTMQVGEPSGPVLGMVAASYSATLYAGLALLGATVRGKRSSKAREPAPSPTRVGYLKPAVLQVLLGLGLWVVPGKRSRRWLYVLAAAGMYAGFALGIADIDYSYLDVDFVDDETAILWYVIGIFAHVVGFFDTLWMCRRYRARANAGGGRWAALVIQSVSGTGLFALGDRTARKWLYLAVPIFALLVLVLDGAYTLGLLGDNVIVLDAFAPIAPLAAVVHVLGVVETWVAVRRAGARGGAPALGWRDVGAWLLGLPRPKAWIRKALYAVSAIALGIGVALGHLDLDYTLLDIDFMDDETAWLMANVAACVYLAKILDTVRYRPRPRSSAIEEEREAASAVPSGS